MKSFAAVILCLGLWAGTACAAEIDLATLTCAKYQNEILGTAGGTEAADPINTVMWLFGYSVAKSGAHVMYGEALAAFGFSLDAECKNKPSESLLEAVSAVKPSSRNPMDLSTLDCATFAGRHIELNQSDRESADTIMMWLFGFSVAASGSHMFDAGALNAFEPALLAECAKHPDHSLLDALGAVKLKK
jgi:HdeA/HdeB family